MLLTMLPLCCVRWPPVPLTTTPYTLSAGVLCLLNASCPLQTTCVILRAARIHDRLATRHSSRLQVTYMATHDTPPVSLQAAVHLRHRAAKSRLTCGMCDCAPETCCCWTPARTSRTATSTTRCAGAVVVRPGIGCIVAATACNLSCWVPKCHRNRFRSLATLVECFQSGPAPEPSSGSAVMPALGCTHDIRGPVLPWLQAFAVISSVRGTAPLKTRQMWWALFLGVAMVTTQVHRWQHQDPDEMHVT